MPARRIPLRPLTRILEARDRGANPDAIEQENLRARHEEMRDRNRKRAEGRLVVICLAVVFIFGTIGARMASLAATAPREPVALSANEAIVATRSDIVDRTGRVLATNMLTHSLYAQTEHLVDPARAARELARIFPNDPKLREADLLRRFTDGRSFLWLRRSLSAEQKQAVHDIGEPGLLFGPREMRLYPNGRLAAHVLGGAGFGVEGVHAAEIIGTAGIEKALDDRLRDPARADEPLQLSLDLSVQAVAREVLARGMRAKQAKGAALVLMKAETGEVVSMVSLPDFDPNDRPAIEGPAAQSPLFNRAVQGVYELGSTFKIFTAAQAIELGLMNRHTLVNTKGPVRWGKHTINDFHHMDPIMSLSNVIVESSNVGTARVAQQIGVQRQKEFLDSLGLFDATGVELVEAPGAKPLLPPHWSELSTMTISYGHGMSASPLHLASAYASLLNGGHRVTPTLLKRDGAPEGEQVVTPEVSATARIILREVVTEGTASFARLPGYAVGGKTGTADKPLEHGVGYYDNKVITTFASVFPAEDPEYVLVVTLDEPVDYAPNGEARRTAGWTAVPVAADVISRTAPLLGLRPDVELVGLDGVKVAVR